jgi:histone-lysine N-methyltransferase SETMAR
MQKTPHSPAMAALSQKFGLECLKNPLYSPDLALSDFHLLGPLKKHLGGHRFQTVVEVQEAVSQWFNLQSREFYTDGIHSLITHYHKCLNCQCNYVDKWAIVPFSHEKYHFE